MRLNMRSVCTALMAVLMLADGSHARRDVLTSTDALVQDLVDFTRSEHMPSSATVDGWLRWFGARTDAWSADAPRLVQYVMDAAAAPKQPIPPSDTSQRIFQALERLAGKIAAEFGKEKSVELVRQVLTSLRATSDMLEQPQKNTLYEKAVSILQTALEIAQLEIERRSATDLVAFTTYAVLEALDGLSADTRAVIADALDAIDNADDPAFTRSFLALMADLLDNLAFNSYGLPYLPDIPKSQLWASFFVEYTYSIVSEFVPDFLVLLGIPYEQDDYDYQLRFDDLRVLDQSAATTTLRVVAVIEGWLSDADSFNSNITISEVQAAADKLEASEPGPEYWPNSYYFDPTVYAYYYQDTMYRIEHSAKVFAANVLKAWASDEEAFERLRSSMLTLIRDAELAPLQAVTSIALHSAHAIAREASGEAAQLSGLFQQLKDTAYELRSDAISKWYSFYKANLLSLAEVVYNTGRALRYAILVMNGSISAAPAPQNAVVLETGIEGMSG